MTLPCSRRFQSEAVSPMTEPLAGAESSNSAPDSPLILAEADEKLSAARSMRSLEAKVFQPLLRSKKSVLT